MAARPDPLLPESVLADEEERVEFVASRAIVLQGLLYFGGLAVFLFLMIQYGAAMSPLLVGLAGALLLWPLRHERPARALLLAGGAVVGFWLLKTLGGVLAPFVLVFLLAYMLNPAVEAALRRWKVPRWASALALTLVVVGLMGAVVFLLVPMLVEQIQKLATDAIALLRRLPALVAGSPALDSLERAGIVERDALVEQLSTFLPQQIQTIARGIPAALGTVTRQIGSLLGIVTTVALVPVLLFYMLSDFPRIRHALAELFPRWRGNRSYLTRSGEVVGSYLRGQLTISAISSVMVAVPLLLLGTPFALLLGVLAGVLNMIPNVGSLVTYVLGTALMLAFGTTADVIAVLAVLTAQTVLEQSVLTPKIMSSSVGLHPILVILSLFVFSAFLGFLGLLIAVPATALLLRLYHTFREGVALDLAAQSSLIVSPGDHTPAVAIVDARAEARAEQDTGR